MSEINQGYHALQYSIQPCAKIGTDFYPMEKTSKIAYRMIDLQEILTKSFDTALTLFSSQIKELVLMIESTRFFCVSFPLFFGDKSGKSFFENKTILQCAEKISITSHLALKTIFGADRLGLIRLGTIATYAIGYMPIFKWALEGTIMLYNFFGSWEGWRKLTDAKAKLQIACKKIEKWTQRLANPIAIQNDCEKNCFKQRKWETIKSNLELDRTRAWFKIAATLSKFILIAFAVFLAATNIWNVTCHLTILSLGIFSDAVGLTGFFHQEYYPPINF